MPVNATWDSDAQKVIRLTIEGQWSWAEFYSTTLTIIAMMERVRTRVNFIVESRTDYVPDEALRQLEAASNFFLHPQAGITVMIGTRGYLRNLTSAFGHLYPKAALRLMVAETADEARALLTERPMERAAQPTYINYQTP